MSDVKEEMDALDAAMPKHGAQEPAEESAETPAVPEQAVSNEAVAPDAVAETGEKEPVGSPPAEGDSSENSEVSALKAELARIREKNRAYEADKAAREVLNVPPPIWAQPQAGQQQRTQQPMPQNGIQTQQANQPAEPEMFNLYDAEGNLVQVANPNHAVRQAMQPLQAQIEAFQKQAIEKSEEEARAQYQDFDHAMTGFQNAALVNPDLVRQMREHANPGEFAYRIGMLVAGAPQVAPQGANTQTVPQVQQATTQQAQTAPTPKLPSSLSDHAAPGGAMAKAREPVDPLDAALPKHFG